MGQISALRGKAMPRGKRIKSMKRDCGLEDLVLPGHSLQLISRPGARPLRSHKACFLLFFLLSHSFLVESKRPILNLSQNAQDPAQLSNSVTDQSPLKNHDPCKHILRNWAPSKNRKISVLQKKVKRMEHKPQTRKISKITSDKEMVPTTLKTQ